jgi:hypothetical protein
VCCSSLTIAPPAQGRWWREGVLWGPRWACPTGANGQPATPGSLLRTAPGGLVPPEPMVNRLPPGASSERPPVGLSHRSQWSRADLTLDGALSVAGEGTSAGVAG